MFCQVEFPVSGWSPFQRRRTESGVAGRNREARTMRRPWLTGGRLRSGEGSVKEIYVCINCQCRSENDFSFCVELVITLGSKRALV